MTLYMTPEKYRTMGLGIDLEGVEDFELAAIIDRAGSIAESYCSVPLIPRRHSFLGGQITVDSPEEHSWRVPEHSFDIGQRRIYPYHYPVISVEQFRVYVTNTQYVEIAPSEIFINNTDRYIEVISLAFTGVGLFGAILPSLGLMKPVSRTAYTYGRTYDQPEERLYPTDAFTYRALNQFWKADPAPIVEIGGVVQTTGFTVDRDEGVVIFDTPLPTDSIVTASYSYRLPDEIRNAIAPITTQLLGEREMASRAMTGVQSIKMGEITVSRTQPKLSAETLADCLPSAAWLLDGFKYTTIRG